MDKGEYYQSRVTVMAWQNDGTGIPSWAEHQCEHAVSNNGEYRHAIHINNEEGFGTAKLGDWLIRSEDGIITTMRDAAFRKMFKDEHE